MRQLLAVKTLPPYGHEKHTSIVVHADAILYEPHQFGSYTSRYTMPGALYAISMIGPEQAVRAVAAGCALDTHQRIRLNVIGPVGHSVVVRWADRWRCRAVRLTGSTMHLVALPEVTVAGVVEDSQHHIIIAEGDNPTINDLQRAIYERLTLMYETPLIPLDQPGQSPNERRMAEAWCSILTEKIMASRSFVRLKGHREQTNTSWSMAGRLNLGQGTLDAMVSNLVRSGGLPFPAASRSAARSPAQEEPSLSG